MTFTACPVHRFGTLDPVARHVHGHASGHQVPEHLGVAVERGPVGGGVAPFVPEAQRFAAALFHGPLERVVIAALDGFQQRGVPLVLGAVHVQRIGRASVVHGVVVVVVVIVVVVVVDDVVDVDVVVVVTVAVAAATATATAHHRAVSVKIYRLSGTYPRATTRTRVR